MVSVIAGVQSYCSCSLCQYIYPSAIIRMPWGRSHVIQQHQNVPFLVIVLHKIFQWHALFQCIKYLKCRYGTACKHKHQPHRLNYALTVNLKLLYIALGNICAEHMNGGAEYSTCLPNALKQTVSPMELLLTSMKTKVFPQVHEWPKCDASSGNPNNIMNIYFMLKYHTYVNNCW